jgi:hypothetical protein
MGCLNEFYKSLFTTLFIYTRGLLRYVLRVFMETQKKSFKNSSENSSNYFWLSLFRIQFRPSFSPKKARRFRRLFRRLQYIKTPLMASKTSRHFCRKTGPKTVGLRKILVSRPGPLVWPLKVIEQKKTQKSNIRKWVS